MGMTPVALQRALRIAVILGWQYRYWFVLSLLESSAFKDIAANTGINTDKNSSVPGWRRSLEPELLLWARRHRGFYRCVYGSTH